MATKNRAEQAMDGLTVVAAGGIVLVEDGHTHWLAEEARWDAAYDALARLPVVEGDDGSMEAYGELCTAITRGGGVVAAIDGGSTHGSPEAQRALIIRALGAELIDQEMATAMGLDGPGVLSAEMQASGEYGVEGGPRVMDYQSGESLEGRPSAELVEASRAAGPIGAVGARRDDQGVWQFVRPEDATPRT